MRLLTLTVATIAILAITAASPGDSGHPPTDPGMTMRAAFHVTPRQTIKALNDTQLLEALRGAKKARRVRIRLQRLRKRFPNLPFDKIEEPYRLTEDRQYIDLSGQELELQIHEMEIEANDREMIYYDEDTSRPIYDPVPEDPTIRGEVIDDPAVLDVAKSVVAIVERDAMSFADGSWSLDISELKTVENGSFWLCDFAPQFGRPSADLRGTGFLVADDKIVTAGHVARTSDFLESVYFVFGFVMETEFTARTVFSKDDVYEGEDILVDQAEEGRDYAVIQLDRAVEGYEPLAFRKSGKPADDDRFYMIGHPNGLPQMYAGPASMEDNEPCAFFVSRLTSYPQNSGSPVFSESSNEVVGLLASDLGSFTEYCDCLAPAVYDSAQGLAGAHITRSNLFAGYLEHPGSIFIQCRTTNAEIALIDTDGPWYVEADADKEINFASPMYLTQLGGECELTYWPYPGETWAVVDAETPGEIKMIRCEADF